MPSLAIVASILLAGVDAHAALTQQGSKLTVPLAEELGGKSGVGASVALSADGNTALVGAPRDNSGVGAAWVLTRSGGIWTTQAKLVGKVGELVGTAAFGSTVSLSADGSTALVGAPNDNGGIGAAWVFVRTGGGWAQQGAKITPAGSEEIGKGSFGNGAALSADGNIAVISAPEDNTGAGGAWVFARTSGLWTQQTFKLTPKPGEETAVGEFGWSVALSGDGATALLGATGDASSAGAAWVFTRSGASWSQQSGKLTPAVGEEIGNAEFGYSTALSADGNTALVGGPFDNGLLGAAWVFTRDEGLWTQQGAKLVPGDHTGSSRFGWSASISSNGNTAAFGAPQDNATVGAAWVFRRGPSGHLIGWNQLGTGLVPSDVGGKAAVGSGVALAGDGDSLLAGGPEDNSQVGAAWLFGDPAPAATTGGASGVAPTSATLNGSVAAGASNHAYFQYGTTTAYGVATATQSLGEASSATAVSAAVAGLALNTTYHFRLVSENSSGTSFGADQTFTTPSYRPIGCRCQKPPPPSILAASQSHRVWR